MLSKCYIRWGILLDYSILSRTQGQLAHLKLLGCQIDVYDLSYTNQRNSDFPHAHPFHEFYYILGGKVTLKVGNKKQQLKKGDILFVASGIEHMYLSEESSNCEYVNIAFDLRMDQPSVGRSAKEQDDFRDLIEDENFLIQNLLAFGTRHVRDKGGCLRSLENIVQCLEQSYLGDFICLMSYEVCFFLSALQNFSDIVVREDFKDEVRRLSDRRAVPAIKMSEYIWNHCEENITIEQIADALGYSKRSAQRILSDYYSVGYSVLVTHYRVAKLKMALQNGTDTLESFSEKCGYNDTRVLSRNFMKITGMTVAKFKQNLKKQ